MVVAAADVVIKEHQVAPVLLGKVIMDLAGTVMAPAVAVVELAVQPILYPEVLD
jgi:hypothetical protein